VAHDGAARARDALEIVVVETSPSSAMGARYRVDDAGEHRLAETSLEGISPIERVGEAAARILVGLAGDEPPDAVGHRLVHGGPALRAPTLVDDAVLAQLRAATPFARRDLPAAVAAVATVRARVPAIPQVVCFDTGFHASLPESQWRLPIPRSLGDGGVRRYGFHGLACEHIVGSLGAATLGRAVIVHLGDEVSVTAVAEGRSIATTTGFTPTGGLPAGTRSGDLDPGVLVYLEREAGYDAEHLATLVDEESGLLGLGGSSDVRELLARRDRGHRDAALAIEVLCTDVAMAVGAAVACLGSLDTVVFTAGIGERAATIRAEICMRLAHLGVRVDRDRNERHASIISDDEAVVTTRVVGSDELAVVARHTSRLVRSGS